MNLPAPHARLSAVALLLAAACSQPGKPSPHAAANTGASAARCAQSGLAITGPAATASGSVLPILVKLQIESQSGGNLQNFLCTGSLLTPSVVITAAHCTRNYEVDPPYTPTANTRFQVGADGTALVPIFSAVEGEGWHESGATDIGLYRLARPVQLPAGIRPFALQSQCSSSYSSFVVAGRMRNGADGPSALYQLAAPDHSTKVSTDTHARGNYVYAATTVMDAGDSGGPWYTPLGDIIAVNSAANGATKVSTGSRLCDVVAEIQQVLQGWGEAQNLQINTSLQTNGLAPATTPGADTKSVPALPSPADNSVSSCNA